jgi:hypothetical protein
MVLFVPHGLLEAEAGAAEGHAHGLEAVGLSADADEEDGDGGPTAIAGEVGAAVLMVGASALGTAVGLAAGGAEAVESFEVERPQRVQVGAGVGENRSWGISIVQKESGNAIGGRNH